VSTTRQPHRDAKADLVVEKVGKTFAGRRALIDVSMTLSPGEISAILGPNGAGKSTLLSILATLSSPTTGHVSWGDTRLVRGSESRRLLGYVGHEPGLYLDLSAFHNLTLFAGLYGLDRATERAQALLDRVGLKDTGVEVPVRTFSRGMMQRLALARALLHEPAILLFDEPSSALDPRGARWLSEELGNERSAGRIVVLVTHDLEAAGALADHTVILRRGRVASDERYSAPPGPDALRSRYAEICGA